MTPHSNPPRTAHGIGGTIRKIFSLPDDRKLLTPMLFIAGTCAALCGAYAYAAGWLTPQRLTPTRIVSTFNDNFGVHAGFRRNHAKGVCVAGYFDGNGAASSLSSATVFDTMRTPVIGRFAIPGGNPSIADAASPVRSMALLFQLPHGEQWRTGMNNTPVFIVNTPQGFYEQLLASKPDPTTGKPDPAKMKAFFDAHPESQPFRDWVKAHPASASLTNISYYSINAFELVDRNGVQHPVRWAMVPQQAGSDAPHSNDPDYLAEDLVQKLAQGPLHWHLMLTLAQPGDVIDDATKAWPTDRTTIDAGTLTLEREVAQSDGPCRDVNYDPLILPHGIQPSNDPLLAARSAAYSRSFNTRAREEAIGSSNAPAHSVAPVTTKGTAS
jgi:catalase